MIVNRNNITQIKSAGYNLKPVVITLGIIGLVLTIYIGYRASVSDSKLYSISLIALFCGLLSESFRISGSWKTVISVFIVSYFFSLLNFLPGKDEDIYNFENHIESWPYVFIFFYTLLFTIVHKDKVTTKLTEGITLLQSLSLVYWIIDYGFTNYHNWFAITLLTIAFLLIVFSIINALTNLHLSGTTRLTLSIWSTIIMFAFAIDNIIRVFGNPDIESSKYLPEGLYIGIQFFLLGVSAVYIMQNFILLALFIHSKTVKYKNHLAEYQKIIIDRYSDEQVFIGHSLFCIFYAGTLYGLNYMYDILPRHTMIWFVFFTFPVILKLTDIIYGRKSHS